MRKVRSELARTAVVAESPKLPARAQHDESVAHETDRTSPGDPATDENAQLDPPSNVTANSAGGGLVIGLLSSSSLISCGSDNGVNKEMMQWLTLGQAIKGPAVSEDPCGSGTGDASHDCPPFVLTRRSAPPLAKLGVAHQVLEGQARGESEPSEPTRSSSTLPWSSTVARR